MLLRCGYPAVYERVQVERNYNLFFPAVEANSCSLKQLDIYKYM